MEVGSGHIFKSKGQTLPTGKGTIFKVGRKTLSWWKCETLPSDKTKSFPVEGVVIFHIHSKTFLFPVGNRKHLFFKLWNVSTSRGVITLLLHLSGLDVWNNFWHLYIDSTLKKGEGAIFAFWKSPEILLIYASFQGRVYVYGNDHPGKVCPIYVKYSPLKMQDATYKM